jgi:hypothetical protein
MNATTLLLHCGAREATLEQIAAVPLPEETTSYKPLPHYDMALNTLRIGEEMLGGRGFRVDRAHFGLDRKGARMFGVVSFSNGVEGMGLAVGFRNSYDKSMSAGFAIGGRVVVCDNLLLAGELVVMRKHTGGIVEELRDRLILTFHQAHQTWDGLVEDRQRMQALELSDDQAHELLGRAFGQRLVSPKQFLRISREWRKPRHAEFEPRTLWSLYNAVTEVFKGLPVHTVMEKHIRLHRFATQIIPRN